ncbi:hypothetical protein NHX12_015549 [Muraenolepis orangiensis]|uniref:NACHT domain-containing protein n=1 Tax=Muraenolepis orangiensis TaxID=630683 RepID=A0A9Q0D9Z0_9TELE|nr:hypothetical protein NHX12_015549 [Muraenolepis orangiensis]
MQKFRRVFEGIAKAGQPTGLNDFYTELFITERVSGEVNKEHEVRLIEIASRKPAKEETPIKCEDIFKPVPGKDHSSRTIMTTGVAGIGKTVLTQKFTLDWAEGKANHDIHFTLPFTFRELNLLKEKEFSLVELLHHFFIQTKGICRYDRFQVVFILDGLDECRLPLDFQNNPIWTDVTKSTSVDVLLTNLIRGDLLPFARIWITTRPAAANQIPAECVGMVTEVRGFTNPQKEEYFRKRFRENRKTTLPKAHDIMTTYVKRIESFNRYPGQHAVDASQAEEVMEFKGEELRVGRSPIIDSAQFIRAVADNMKERLFTTTANRAQASVAANRKEAYNSLINQMAVLNPDNWDHDNPRFGDNEVRALCDVLHVNQQEAHLGFT